MPRLSNSISYQDSQTFTHSYLVAIILVMATKEEAVALKEKLQELVKSIVEGDDFTVNAADEAIVALSSLKDFKCATSLSRSLDNIPVPPRFLCPLSGQLMTDPVILATAQTFDRTFIQKWLEEVHRICPQTQKVLSHCILTPNSLLQSMISEWCIENKISLPNPVWEIHPHQLTDAHKHRLDSLLYMLSLALPEQKDAAKELRHISKHIPAFRTLFTDPETIRLFLAPLSPGAAGIDSELHEDLITTILNLSIDEDNKKIFGENATVISLLVESLKTGTTQARSNAAAAIFSLSALDSNRHIIGKTNAIRYLVDLLEEGNPNTMKDAASALFKLCITHQNKGRTVREGAVQVILGKIMDHVLVDELLSLLALLSTHSKAVEALVSHGAVPFLLVILKENVSERVDENCVAILSMICFNDKDKRKEIREDEKVNGTLAKLAQRGTSRAKRKANAILDRLGIGIAESSSTESS